MSDSEFLGYVLVHSETERHLFAIEDAVRLLKLSGLDAVKTDVDCGIGGHRFVGICANEADRLVNAARALAAERARKEGGR
jgi:hypothetical protein